jgi:hypothetical protein
MCARSSKPFDLLGLHAVRKTFTAFVAGILLAAGADISKAQDFQSPPTPSDIVAIATEGFPAASKRLGQTLAKGYQPGQRGKAGSSGNPAFSAWLDLWRWCDLFAQTAEEQTTALVQRSFFKERGTDKLFFVSPGLQKTDALQAIGVQEAATMAAHPQIREQLEKAMLPPNAHLPTGSLGAVAGKALAADLLSKPEISRSFFSSLSDHDYLPLVLQNLRTIRDAHPGKWQEYANLAIAIAIVNDSAIPDFWPHIQVTPGLVPQRMLPVEQQFARWVDANESQKLLLDPRKLSPGQLKFIVDAFVTEDELAWARKNIQLNRSNFERAFFQVNHRQDRIKNKVFHWTETPYTLAWIRQKGGICVDQAYYATIAGKAHGLPTLFFAGQGKDGGHAWFGYMKGDDRWVLDCGRYSQQNYAIGQALDPQTWQPISDHELKLLAARFRDKPPFAASMNDLAMAAIFQNQGLTSRAGEALQSAVHTCPENPDAWAALGRFLEQTGASSEQHRRFHEDAIQQFSSIADLKVKHQTALAAIHREGGDGESANKLERNILLKNRRNRSDLSVGIAAQKINAILATGNIDEAAAEFHRQLYTLGKNAGGDFVRDVATPYIQALLDRDNKVRARRSLATMRQHLSPERGSLLDLAIREMEAAAR